MRMFVYVLCVVFFVVAGGLFIAGLIAVTAGNGGFDNNGLLYGGLSLGMTFLAAVAWTTMDYFKARTQLQAGDKT